MGAFSACSMHDPLVAAEGLYRVQAQSVVAEHRCGCPETRGILVPRPGIEPRFPALEGGFLIAGPPAQSLFRLVWFFFRSINAFKVSTLVYSAFKSFQFSSSDFVSISLHFYR